MQQELGKKGREVIRSGSVPLGGDTEEEDYTSSEILSVEWEDRTTYWETKLWGPNQEDKSP